MEKLNAKEIILQNLSEAYDRHSRKLFIYDVQIKELAYLLVNESYEEDTEDIELVFDKLRSIYWEFVSIAKEGGQTELCGNDFGLKFCSYAGEEFALRKVGIDVIKDFEEAFEGPEIKIACFPSRSAERAYEELAKNLPNAVRIICDGIAEVCEEVSDGKCDLCMLPVYSSADGIIQNVYRQIVRNGLSPVMALDIPSDRDYFLRFTLFAANLCRRKNADMMSLTIAAEDPAEIAFLPSALSFYGAKFADMTSLPGLPYDEKKTWQLTFSVKDADLLKIYLFLQIHFPRFEINGIYEEIGTQQT